MKYFVFKYTANLKRRQKFSNSRFRIWVCKTLCVKNILLWLYNKEICWNIDIHQWFLRKLFLFNFLSCIIYGNFENQASFYKSANSWGFRLNVIKNPPYYVLHTTNFRNNITIRIVECHHNRTTSKTNLILHLKFIVRQQCLRIFDVSTTVISHCLLSAFAMMLLQRNLITLICYVKNSSQPRHNFKYWMHSSVHRQ